LVMKFSWWSWLWLSTNWPSIVPVEDIYFYFFNC
jgi:hypothetical protein